MTTIRNAMLCPVCHDELKLMDRQGVEIDYCPQCRGVWLDRGELDKIIDRTPAYAEERPSGSERVSWRREDDHQDFERHRDGRRHGQKRAGFLEDLFDFD